MITRHNSSLDACVITTFSDDEEGFVTVVYDDNDNPVDSCRHTDLAMAIIAHNNFVTTMRG